MHFSIDFELPNCKPCMLCVEGSVATDKESSIMSRMVLAESHIQNNMSLDTFAQDSRINNFREALRQLGRNPNRHRISSEALFRRVLQGKQINSINPIVDLNNYMSLYSFLPVGSYDCAKISNEVSMRVGSQNETMSTISKGDFNISGSILLSDFEGAFGSPINDSTRSMVTDQTTDFLMVFYAVEHFDVEKIMNELNVSAPRAGVKISSSSFVTRE